MLDFGRAVARTGAPSIKSALVVKWRMILRGFGPPRPVPWSALLCLTGQPLVPAAPRRAKIWQGWGLYRSVVLGGWGFYLALAATISASWLLISNLPPSNTA